MNSKSDEESRIAWEGSGIAPLHHREPLSHVQSTMIPTQFLSLSAANTPTSVSLDSQFSEQSPPPFTDTCSALSNGKIPHVVLIYLVKVSTREQLFTIMVFNDPRTEHQIRKIVSRSPSRTGFGSIQLSCCGVDS